MDGTHRGERHHGGLSILVGTVGLGCPHLMVAPHPPCLADMCSWRFHHFGLEVVSLPATGTPAACCCGPVLSQAGDIGGEAGAATSAGDIHPAAGGWELGRGEKVEGMEIPVLALGAGMALGIPCCHAVSAFLVPAKRAMALLPLMQGKHPCEAERGSGTLAVRTAGTHV